MFISVTSTGCIGDIEDGVHHDPGLLETQQTLVSMGGMGDSYDDVIRMLIAAVKEGKGK